MSSIITINPTTEQPISEYKLHSRNQLVEIIEQCTQVQQQWAQWSLDKRLALIERFSGLLKSEKEILAGMITQEMGKPISQASAEVEKCTTVCEYYIANSERLLKPVYAETNFKKSYYMYAPLGIIFGIMPWNFPLWQVMRFAIPNLIAGNGIILKHAPNVTGLSLLIEKMFVEATFPTNLFRSVIINEPLAEEIIKNSKVNAVTITGSKKAGAAVASQAGKYLKKIVLELGGNDPYIVLEDADLDISARECVESRLFNTGQVCIAAKRIIVVESVKEKLKTKILDLVKQYQYSDPKLSEATLGPIARKDLQENLENQVKKSLQQGAECLYKSEVPSGKGYYYPVTVLSNITPENLAFQEELFGPVFAIISVKDMQQAISYANKSEYGLTGVLFTRNLKKGKEICEKELQFGTCNLNSRVSSDPQLPFGGIKNSGFGRELSEYGVKEFTNIKTININ